jgi:hypothetical protein
MLIIKQVRQLMLIYYILSPKNPGTLLYNTLIREFTKERPARNKENCTSFIKKQYPLPAFFHL